MGFSYDMAVSKYERLAVNAYDPNFMKEICFL